MYISFQKSESYFDWLSELPEHNFPKYSCTGTNYKNSSSISRSVETLPATDGPLFVTKSNTEMGGHCEISLQGKYSAMLKSHEGVVG